MLAVISPAKTLDFESALPAHRPTQPEHLGDAEELIGVLRKKSRGELQALMDISPALADLNWRRNRDWKLARDGKTLDPDEARAAIFAFKGDVYTGFSLDVYRSNDFRFAQKHLRILSGLYGVLRPLDLILPYRLEMGTALKTKRGRNLYEFWGERITDSINRALAKSGEKTLVNLASQEYFGAIRKDGIKGRIIHIHFREWKNGSFKVVSLFAKKARGLMSDFIIRSRIENAEEIQAFEGAGYRYQPELGDDTNWHFTRGKST
ncbi:MAG: peroxide stress protein YaaA [Verrucomicrobiae bacterium]|nr:peroxide stress protein YaaA [Verrucomicrobiae bacterium]